MNNAEYWYIKFFIATVIISTWASAAKYRGAMAPVDFHTELVERGLIVLFFVFFSYFSGFFPLAPLGNFLAYALEWALSIHVRVVMYFANIKYISLLNACACYSSRTKKNNLRGIQFGGGLLQAASPSSI